MTGIGVIGEEDGSFMTYQQGSASDAALWSERWSTAAETLVSSAIRELLKVTEQPGVISFAGGLPATECFPDQELAAAAQRALAQAPGRVLQYSPTEGMRELRELIAELMQARGLPVQWEEVLILSGSQQGLDIIGKLLIDRSDPVIVENPTYLGALQAWRPYGPQFVALPIDQDGLQIAAVAEALERLDHEGRRPKFLYIVSCFQNPTGVTLEPERRRQLIELALRYELPILEDDPYGELRYSGTPLPTLAALDHELCGEQRHVIYLSTFSKLLAPGLRVGWVIAPAALRQRIVQSKQGLDLHTGSLAQAIAYEACRDGLLTRQLALIRQTYALRRDSMLSALQRLMPEGVSWTRPDGGMFLWLTLPSSVDAGRLLERALQHQVAFVPGAAFYPNGGGEQTLRLNFSHADPEQIEEGVRRLSIALISLMA